MPTGSMPGTIKRSSKKAQDTYEQTLESAEAQYGDGERAHRTAFASLKHSFEKVGDHWEAKAEKGPSDERAEHNAEGERDQGETAGGVDVNGHTKEELYVRAKKLEVKGRSEMTKQELARAIARMQD